MSVKKTKRTDIIPSINSDHFAIILHFNNIDRQKHDPSFWKFNASLLVRKVFRKEELLVTDPKKILGVIEGFYSGLYKKDDLEPSENLMNTFLENPLMPRLSVDDSQVCEGKLTIEECVKSLVAASQPRTAR